MSSVLKLRPASRGLLDMLMVIKAYKTTKHVSGGLKSKTESKYVMR